MWMDNWVLNTPKKMWPLYSDGNLGSAPFLFRFFETQNTVVVLSSSNKAEKETHLTECEKYNVPILKRKGGGGTVVLGPGCLVFTFAFYAKDIFSNSKYFAMINSMWIDALTSANCCGLSQSGISDISYKDKKIAGTSVFRKKHLLVYQGSLLVDPDFELISKLLCHPSREPSYRNGRNHSDFLISTKAMGCSHTAYELAKLCEVHVKKNVFKLFHNEVLDT